jgi:hypothetical protein
MWWNCGGVLLYWKMAAPRTEFEERCACGAVNHCNFGSNQWRYLGEGVVSGMNYWDYRKEICRGDDVGKKILYDLGAGVFFGVKHGAAGEQGTGANGPCFSEKHGDSIDRSMHSWRSGFVGSALSVPFYITTSKCARARTCNIRHHQIMDIHRHRCLLSHARISIKKICGDRVHQNWVLMFWNRKFWRDIYMSTNKPLVLVIIRTCHWRGCL